MYGLQPGPTAGLEAAALTFRARAVDVADAA